jgi:hypothetical protein
VLLQKQEKVIEEAAKFTKADKFFARKLLMKMIKDWKIGVITSKQEQADIDIYLMGLKTKRMFKRWTHVVPDFRLENIKEEDAVNEKIAKHIHKEKLRRVFRGWRSEIKNWKKEKAVEQYKKMLWEKANSLMKKGDDL